MYTDQKTRTCKNSQIILEHMPLTEENLKICLCMIWSVSETKTPQYFIEINLSVKSQNVLYSFSNRV